MNKLRIAVGSDHRGFSVRAKLIDLLERLGHEVDDVGTFSSDAVDYPDIAALVAGKISGHEADRGFSFAGPAWGCASPPTSSPASAPRLATTT